MKMNRKDWTIILVIVLNLIAVSYWGGTTRARVDSTANSLESFMEAATNQHTSFQKNITDLKVRIGVAESHLLRTEE